MYVIHYGPDLDKVHNEDESPAAKSLRNPVFEDLNMFVGWFSNMIYVILYYVTYYNN